MIHIVLGGLRNNRRFKVYRKQTRYIQSRTGTTREDIVLRNYKGRKNLN